MLPFHGMRVVDKNNEGKYNVLKILFVLPILSNWTGNVEVTKVFLYPFFISLFFDFMMKLPDIAVL